MTSEQAPPRTVDEARVEAMTGRLRLAANGLVSLKTNSGDYGLCDDAADLIASLQARVVEVERERAAGWVGIRINELQSRAEAAEAERDRLRRALEDLRELDGTLHNVASIGILRARIQNRIDAALKDTTQ